jgi:hypothetical protein
VSVNKFFCCCLFVCFLPYGYNRQIAEKSVQELKGPGCCKTFIHGGDCCQLMAMNKKCKWKSSKMLEKAIPEV